MAGGTAVLAAAAPAATKAATSLPSWVGPAISAGGSILGGLLGGSSQKKLWKKQYRAQKEFAQHAVRWRAADARAAGISPLVAMGMSPYQGGFSGSGSPVGDAISQAAGIAGDYVSGRQNAKMQRLLAAKEMDWKERQVRATETEAAARAAEAQSNADYVKSQMIHQTIRRFGNYLQGDKLAGADSEIENYGSGKRPTHISTPYGTWEIDPRWSPQQVVEDEYGGAIGEGYGLKRGAMEAGHKYLDSVYERFPTSPEKIDSFFRFLDQLNAIGKRRLW